MPIFADPVISLDEVIVQNFSFETLDLEVTIRVENPNVFGVNLAECPFTVMVQNDGKNRKVATGNTGSASVRRKDSTVIRIPVRTHNAALAQALAGLVIGGKIGITIEGIAVIKFLLSTRRIPFSRALFVTRDQAAAIVTGQKTAGV